ncbi:MAG: hypothetical protein ACE1ZJ_06265, partial [Nitrospirales bacterium]
STFRFLQILITKNGKQFLDRPLDRFGSGSGFNGAGTWIEKSTKKNEAQPERETEGLTPFSEDHTLAVDSQMLVFPSLTGHTEAHDHSTFP